ncbi:KinB-signaling pathway activation protein [Neobacillus mesonae]|uniref:KinB-signaling pathway activation protein n=1 Tax=Neobacillus mesonae TaxID=1193713 RepID=UPI00203C307A|nr:KinB-signaling pathway activation protein [Neobacillus mesonae]MCM3570112.1 KinB-signaling pathway activation protein [Neobacillus mesonae]
MTSRNLVKLFWKTLLVGGVTTVIVGLIVRWHELAPFFTGFKIIDIISAIVWLFVMGFLFSVISQLGFFAYLTIHRFGLGIFKSVSLWNAVQIVLILFGLFDLVYLRYTNFANSGESLIPYFVPALVLAFIGVLTALVKSKETNREAFIPAMFFMIVVTLIEWVPVLRINSSNWFYLMLFALLACNAYQLLVLHKLNAKSAQERLERAGRNAGAGNTPVKQKKNPKKSTV